MLEPRKLASVSMLVLLATCGRAPLPEPSVEDVVPIASPAGTDVLAPNLSVGPGGVVLSWLRRDPGEPARHTLRGARLEGASWAKPFDVAAGEDFFANWADLPRVVEDDDGGLVAQWLSKLGEGTYAYGAQLAYSDDDGETWVPRGLLHDDDSETEHGFVSLLRRGRGLQAVWLDGRAMLGGQPMQLRSARLDFGEPARSALLDDRVCECCSTSMAMAVDGPVVVYRDRSPEEVRDIAVIRARTGGGWSEPAIVHPDGWTIAGCPVNGPEVAADGRQVAVAWFTAAEGRARVSVSFSADGARSFAPPIVIDDQGPVGRVDVALHEGAAWVSWLAATSEGGGEVRLQAVTPAGLAGAPVVIAQTDVSRAAGVPRLVRDGDRLIVAWLEGSDEPVVRVAAVRLGT